MVRAKITAIGIVLMIVSTASASWFAAASRRHAVSADVRDPHLVAWYKLDGDATDSSGNENHLSTVGTITYSNAVYGAGAFFDGYGGYLGDTAVSNITSFTFALHARKDGAALDGTTGYGSLLGRPGSPVFRLLVQDRTYITCLAQLSAGNHSTANYATSTILSHYAYTYDATTETGTWYIRGVADSTNVGAVAFSNIRIGNSSDTVYFWRGLLDDVRIYDRALSSNDVNRVMLNQRPKHD